MLFLVHWLKVFWVINFFSLIFRRLTESWRGTRQSRRLGDYSSLVDAGIVLLLGSRNWPHTRNHMVNILQRNALYWRGTICRLKDVFFPKYLTINSYLLCILCLRKMSLYLFQVEHLEVPSSQDKIFVFLHRGAMVGGKEASCLCLKRPISIDSLWQVHPITYCERMAIILITKHEFTQS